MPHLHFLSATPNLSLRAHRSAISRAKQNLVLPMLKVPGADLSASEDGMRNSHMRNPGDYIKEARSSNIFSKLMTGV